MQENHVLFIILTAVGSIFYAIYRIVKDLGGFDNEA